MLGYIGCQRGITAGLLQLRVVTRLTELEVDHRAHNDTDDSDRAENTDDDEHRGFLPFRPSIRVKLQSVVIIDGQILR